jgi:hypothetical protein
MTLPGFGTVPPNIVAILLMCCPAQVTKCIVGWVSIVVRALHSGRSGANERFNDKPMDISLGLRATIAS